MSHSSHQKLRPTYNPAQYQKKNCKNFFEIHFSFKNKLYKIVQKN